MNHEPKPSYEMGSFDIILQRRSQSRHKRRKERIQACTIGLSIDEDIKTEEKKKVVEWTRLCTRAKA